MRRYAISMGMLILTVLPLCTWASRAAAAPDAPQHPQQETPRLGRGINMGNMLEAPREGAWGLTLNEAYFSIIKEARFDSVRIPIRWSAHAPRRPPYAVDADFFAHVDWATDAALAEDLTVVINVHHFEELYEHPQVEKDRFLALWGQIASRYKDRPPSLYFDLLNEPHGELGADRWNKLLTATLDVVRQTNPNRVVIIGPAQWNNIAALEKLRLPASDRQLVVTFHYYQPYHFTHQGASWAEGSDAWLGTTWTGTTSERAAVAADLDRAAQWAKRHGRPLYMGEFGAYSKADIASRVRWTEFLRSEAEKRAFSWADWEFASGFGAYDPTGEAWRQPLLHALVSGASR